MKPITLYFGKFVLIAIFVLSVSACSKFNRLLKSDNVEGKLAAAIAYYEKKDYFHAVTLLEDLLPLMQGKKEGEKVMYYYAYCFYGQEDFSSATYHFKKFYETYPRSELAEEGYFMYAYCLYSDSPVYNLDQSSTYRAIEAIVSFISIFPNSTRLSECNNIIDELRKKILLKDYHNTKIYGKLEYYKAAVIALNNFIDDYPVSEFDEEIRFLRLEAQYNLSKSSTELKQKERFADALNYYENFIDKYPQSKRIKQAESYYDVIIKKIKG
ncbi:MAG: hypothetical protein A3H98_13895 [Bacteroidetes bacterium RIFCSPLOWO2_02_FULL_36_8]|nr:MAG: hypothetical protein A3H98_13895 [Bacteroidetes bacterium RIFCSPLOWO2_02_FULL_36_8]OFY70989.1 MAG: hypothetical protein A3G23_12805 [Bacteroidetes bacterium RIFCSPLOWO2_12_FULL_37_12]